MIPESEGYSPAFVPFVVYRWVSKKEDGQHEYRAVCVSPGAFTYEARLADDAIGNECWAVAMANLNWLEPVVNRFLEDLASEHLVKIARDVEGPPPVDSKT